MDSPATGSPAPQSNGNSHGEAFIEGLVYPPPAIRETVDKTAAHIGKRGADGPALEDKIRQKGSTGKFSFINATDPYHPYYQYRLKLVRSGADPAISVAISGTAGGVKAEAIDDGRPKVPQPAPYDFLLDVPSMAAVDLDIIKLTALFTARSGRRFQTDLASREQGNYQFEFLQPSHSLFPFFNRLVEQYTKVLVPDTDRLERLTLHAGLGGPLGKTVQDDNERRSLGRKEVMTEVGDRVEWEKWESEQRKKQEDEEEKKRVAFAEVDWQDFVVVTTIEFTDADDMGDLHQPFSISDVQNMSMREKKRAALSMQGQEAEIDEETILAQAEEAAKNAGYTDGISMEVDSGDEEQAARKQADEIKTVEPSTGAVKIKPAGYVPRSKRNAKIATTRCQICDQQIPVDEITEHVRIELLDPRWKEKQKITDANRSAASLLGTGSDVSASLRELARKRSDIFSTAGMSEAEKIKAAQEEARRKAKDREAVVWDGHVASGELTTNRFQTGANLNQQIEAIHRAKGLTAATDPRAIGPGLTQQQPEREYAPLPSLPGSISAAPQAGMINQNAPQMYNPYGMPIMQPPTSFAPPMSGAPPGFGFPPGFMPPPPPPGFLPPGGVRPADGGPDGEPSAKRARMSKLPQGQYHNEQIWIDTHPDPINVVVQLPNYPDRPEWKCDGSQIQLEDVPLTALIGTLRDRIQAKTTLPIGRQQLRINDRILTNSNTLASMNFETGEQINLTIKDAKKK